jgi:hypothetical protein
VNAEKLTELMTKHPRKTSREYAEMAAARGMADDIDADELLVREIQKSIRHLVRDSKSDPELAFVSIASKDGEEVYAPAQVCTKAEAQKVLDNYASRIEGTVKRAMKLRDYWNGKPFSYQLRFNWG